MQEEYIKEEQRSLKRELLRAQEEVKRIQAVPLVIGQFLEMIDRNSGIIGSTTGSNYYVRILSTLNRELLKPSSSVALHRHSNALVDILPPEADSSISLLSQSERPDVTYQVYTWTSSFSVPSVIRSSAGPCISHRHVCHDAAQVLSLHVPQLQTCYMCCLIMHLSLCP